LTVFPTPRKLPRNNRCIVSTATWPSQPVQKWTCSPAEPLSVRQTACHPVLVSDPRCEQQVVVVSYWGLPVEDNCNHCLSEMMSPCGRESSSHHTLKQNVVTC
jgi:hypothetical protein